MGARHILVAGVPRDTRAHANPQLFEKRSNLPELARQVVLAKDVDIGHRDIVGLQRADDVVEQRLSPELVAQVL